MRKDAKRWGQKPGLDKETNMYQKPDGFPVEGVTETLPTSPGREAILGQTMDKIIVSIKRRYLLPVVFLVAFSVWLLLCRAYYQSYWEGTMFRVQTVDFNLLHHTLPTTLSQLIIADRDDSIQNVLDSTYGLFGLVITDPSGNSILYRTNKVYHYESWQKHITPEDLKKCSEPPDLLTDPPPLEARWTHPTPRITEAQKTKTKTHGKVLGKIYYIRDQPPSLYDDLTNFVGTGMMELSGAKRSYLFITLTMIGFSLVAILLIWLRKQGVEMKQAEVEYFRRELDIRKKALEHLSAELTAQKARKFWLEKEADQSYKRALNLKQSLERLRDNIRPAFAPSQPTNGDGSVKVRPPVHPPSSVLEEIESIIPELTNSAGTLKSQAGMLNEYCAILEQRQTEMQQIVETAYEVAQHTGASVLDMSPS
jgi:hypothetical protein